MGHMSIRVKNLRKYWKGILGFIAPGAVMIGAAVTDASDGGSAITTAEWVTAAVAMVVTGAAVTTKGNAGYEYVGQHRADDNVED